MSDTKMFIRLIYSVVKRQMAWYVVASVAIGLLMPFSLIITAKDSINYYSILLSVLGIMIYFSPLVFKCFKSRSLFITIPANRSVKAWCILIYSTIIVPLLLFVPAAVVMFTSLKVFNLPVDNLYFYKDAVLQFGLTSFITQQSQYVLLPLLSLLVVFSCRHGVVGKTIGIVIGYMILVAAISGIYGATAVLSDPAAFNEKMIQISQNGIPDTHQVMELIPGLLNFIKIFGWLQVAATGVTFYLLYRKLVNLQA